MLENIFKIDKSMGEARVWQVVGVILLIAIVIFSILYHKGVIQI